MPIGFKALRAFPLIFGVTMSMIAGQVHPNGPEKRLFADRVIRVLGEHQDCVISLAYPKPDEIVDWTTNGIYDVRKPHATTLLLHFNYKGHFWQGVFGGVTFEIKTTNKIKNIAPISRIENVLEAVRTTTKERNERAQKKSGSEWMEPIITHINGTPCIQQNVRGNKARDPRDESYYYFPIDENNVLVLGMILVDNSDRPGLPQSDWHSRAEAFANQLLSKVQVRLEEKGLKK
jgi:hypothetical protein